MKILFAIAEAYPFAKAGGLGDIGASLPKALARLGHEVRVILPGYPWLRAGEPVLRLDIPFGPAMERVSIFEAGISGGVTFYSAVDRLLSGGRRVYGYQDDDLRRSILFSKAIVHLAAQGGWQPDVIHCNDWHTGLAVQYARGGRCRASLARTPIVFTIHNLTYQGPCDAGAQLLIGVNDGFAGSLLARGIAFADLLNTVSPGYLKEILTPKHGMGMDRLLRDRLKDVRAILNGVDYEEFDPAQDPHIPANFDSSCLEGRRANKAELQWRSGLAVDPEAPLLGMVARLSDQKGYDLLCAGLDDIVAMGAQVVVMGVGEERYRKALTTAAGRHPANFAYHPMDEEWLARLVYAGSDFFLSPSAYEPCGLAPLIALRYGSVPIVRRTGGLADTIRDYLPDPHCGLGFTFIRKYPGHLVKTIGAALEVYRETERWRQLQQRAMRADFSWQQSSREYEQMYRDAVARRECELRPPVGARKRPSRSPGVAMAIVHHANQYLITDGYEKRQGITAVVEGYADLLRLHDKYGVPAGLHLSGTLIEAAAWHHPWFLELVKELMKKGLLTPIGGAYSENVMPLFKESVNRRQLDELLYLYGQHIDCAPEDIKVCWIPERVWDTAKLSPVLRSSGLANGGYRHVLLDDRLLYPTNGTYAGSPRALFDSIGPPAGMPDPQRGARVYRIAGSGGLTVISISANCRHWIPPRSPAHWERVGELVELFGRAGEEDNLLVYADDLEKTAGVGGWEAGSLRQYDEFLRWLCAKGGAVTPVNLADWLTSHPPTEEREVEAGTYLELAEAWHAGEDYRRWWSSPAWREHKRYLKESEQELRRAEETRAEERLLSLGWKHYLASSYETAWHDAGTNPSSGPARGNLMLAPWAKAVASHSRAARVMAAAARWFARAHRNASVETADVDEDGCEEVVLRNDRLYAVLAPQFGGRMVYLFAMTTQGGALVIGNPTDDWNFQEELNRFMDRPANHPGALCDIGFEHDIYELSSPAEASSLVMKNVQQVSALYGARKRFHLPHDAAAVTICYELPPEIKRIATLICLSPDYYRLLREGRSELAAYNGQSWRGWRHGEVTVWVACDSSEGTDWQEPQRREVGHGLNMQLYSEARHFHLLIGCGETGEAECRRLLREGMEAIHRSIVTETSPCWRQRQLSV